MMNVMVDLETMGSIPGCKIMSIGAVRFDETGLGDEFYVVISRNQPNLREEAATMKWWDARAEDAKKILKDIDGPEAVELRDGLKSFNRYVTKTGNQTLLWGNGADFDNAILASAYESVVMSPGWKFWNNRCYRTLKNLHPDIPLQRQGVHHHALHDAKTQAEHAVKMLKRYS